MVSISESALSQNYPTRPVRIIAAEVGGTNDQVARMVAPGLSANLGQPVIIENRGTLVMPPLVARAQPDGYSLMLAGSAVWLAEYLSREVPYKMTDFAPVSWVTSSPGILVVHPSVPANSVKELIALAKSRPGELNYSTGTVGNLTHLAPELFKLMAGVNMVGVPYKGGGPALAAVVANQVHFMVSTAGGVTTLIKSGRVRALAVTTAKPSVIFPELPTMAASGLPGFEIVAMNAILAPARTPTAIVARLTQDIAKAVNQPDVRERMLATALEPVGSTPGELAAKIKLSMEQVGRIIKASGIKAE